MAKETNRFLQERVTATSGKKNVRRVTKECSEEEGRKKHTPYRRVDRVK